MTYRSDRPERRGVSRKTVIEAARDEVRVMDFARRLCAEQGKQLRRSGGEHVTRCLLPDHEDRTPSFYVAPQKDLFFCRGCLRGGDVVELARLVWDYSKGETVMAAADLLRTFGHEIPEKPAP